MARARGVRRLSPPPPPTARTITYIAGDMLMPGHKVSGTMRKIFYQNIHERGYCWENVPQSLQEKYFRTFKLYFRWGEETTEAQIRKVFMEHARNRYREMICRINKEKEKPRCLSDAAWQDWLARWNRPDIIARSAQASRNRMSEVAGPGTGPSRHAGGSRSAIEHADDLRLNLGRDPDPFECFEQIHIRKSGEFVDVGSSQISEEVNARVAAAAQHGEDINMVQLYFDVVGMTDRGRVPGLGSVAFKYYGKSPNPRIKYQAAPRQVVEPMRLEFNRRLKEREASLRAHMAAQRAHVKAQVAELWGRIEGLKKELRRRGH